MSGRRGGVSSDRRSKLTSLEGAADLIRDGDHLAIGGIWSHNSPAALVRAIIRRGVAELTLSAGPAAGYAVDLLIASGSVRRALLPNVTYEHLGLAPGFRRAAESGSLELIECDEPSLIAGYRAAASGLPAQPIQSIVGTALAEVRGDLPLRRWQGQGLLDVPAIAPDVVLLHAAESDRFGNLQQRGAVFADRLLAKAASRVVVASVDTVVDNHEVRRQPAATTVPGYLVTGVVEVPFGAHPCSSHGVYGLDEVAMRGYLSDGDAYRQRFVLAPSHEAYLEACGGARALRARLGEGPA